MRSVFFAAATLFIAALLGLGLNYAAYESEIYRGALEAVVWVAALGLIAATLAVLARRGYRYDASEKDLDAPYFLDEAAERPGFVILPKRWIVERSIAWLNRCRRLAKDWENLNRTALAFLHFASIRLMLRKLCNPS